MPIYKWIPLCGEKRGRRGDEKDEEIAQVTLTAMRYDMSLDVPRKASPSPDRTRAGLAGDVQAHIIAHRFLCRLCHLLPFEVRLRWPVSAIDTSTL